MKKWISSLLALVGLLGLGLGVFAQVQPDATWPWIPFVRTWWLVFVVLGACLGLVGIILLVGRLKPRKATADGVTELAEIKSRVRDLLRMAWAKPLLALILCVIPVIAVHVPVHLLLQPFQQLQTGISAILDSMALDFGDMRLGMLMLLVGSLPDLTPLLAALPGLGVVLIALMLVFEPMTVSRAQYFLRLLCGRNPSPLEVIDCFSASYPRTLGGTAYRILWVFLWGLMAFGAPAGIYALAMWVINAYPEALNSHLMTILPILAGVVVAWILIFTLVWINRMLAYCLAPCVLASQRSLPARKALRASRKLMKGQKFRVLGLWLSFLYYFIPAIVAAILLPLISPVGGILGFSQILSLSLRRFFWLVIALNQLYLVYVAPLAYTSFHAFYLERKREVLDADPAMTTTLGIRAREL